MKYCFIITYLLLSLFSCTISEEESLTVNSRYVINLDSIKEEKYIGMSDFYQSDNVAVIPLDTTSNEALIGEIDKVHISKEYILVLDTRIAKKLLVFNKKGDFLRSIGNIGQGPEDYTRPTDFVYNEENNAVYLLDFYAQKIKKYDVESGKFISSIPCPSRSYYIYYYNNHFYGDSPSVNTHSNGHLLVEMDEKNGEITHEFIDPEIYNAGWNGRLANTGGPFFSFAQRGIRFSHFFSNAVFKEDAEKGLIAYVSFKSKDWITQKDLADIDLDSSPDHMMKLLSANKYFNIHDYVERNEHFLCTIQKGIQSYFVTADFAKNDFAYTTQLQEDILFKHIGVDYLNITFGGNTQTGAYYYITPSHKELFSNYSDKLSSLGKSKLEKIMQDTSDKFNGAIICYEFKE